MGVAIERYKIGIAYNIGKPVNKCWEVSKVS